MDKFKMMKTDLENFLHKTDFSEYQKKMREIVNELQMKFRPLAKKHDVDI